MADETTDEVYDPSKPATVYQIYFKEDRKTFVCYGVTNNWSKRSREFQQDFKKKRKKIKMTAIYPFADGRLAAELESELHELRMSLIDEIPPSKSGIKGTEEASYPVEAEKLKISSNHIWDKISLTCDGSINLF